MNAVMAGMIHDYFDDARYAGDGAGFGQILGNYVVRILSRCGSGLSGQRLARQKRFLTARVAR